MLNRHDAIDGSVGETDAVRDLVLDCIIQMFVDKVLEDGRAAHHVLARDDVERCLILLDAARKSLCDVRRNKLQDVRTDGGGHDIRRDEHIQQFFEVRIAVDRLDVLDMNGLRNAPDHLDVIGAACVDLVNQCLGNIDKCDLVARAHEQFPDKAAADVAAAEMDCLFHGNLLSGFLICLRKDFV